MREISRFAGHTIGEASAFDQRVKILKERARLSRLCEGEEVEVPLERPAPGRTAFGVDEGAVHPTSVPTTK